MNVVANWSFSTDYFIGRVRYADRPRQRGSVGDLAQVLLLGGQRLNQRAQAATCAGTIRSVLGEYRQRTPGVRQAARRRDRTQIRRYDERSGMTCERVTSGSCLYETERRGPIDVSRA